MLYVKRSTKNWRMKKWTMNMLQIKSIWSKKLPTIVSGTKKVIQSFVRRKWARVPHLCLRNFIWRKVVLHFSDPKQLLRVSASDDAQLKSVHQFNTALFYESSLSFKSPKTFSFLPERQILLIHLRRETRKYVLFW